MFVWYRLFFIPYSYYRYLFCSGTALRFCNLNRHVWVHYIDNTKITVACMSALLLSIDQRQYWYFIMFSFKLTNGEMYKWWIVKCFYGEIKIRIVHFVACKYWICSFVLFYNTAFFQQTKQSIIFIIWSLKTSTATKCMLSNQSTTKRQDLFRG